MFRTGSTITSSFAEGPLCGPRGFLVRTADPTLEMPKLFLTYSYKNTHPNDNRFVSPEKDTLPDLRETGAT